MKSNGKTLMGRVTIEFEIANYQDITRAAHGDLDPKKIRRVKLQGTVDPGATRLVLPTAIAKTLGLSILPEKIKVTYADGRKAMRPEADDARVFILGREGTFKAILEPKREKALIGAIVLEDLDFLVDCARQRLMPRDPDFIVSEIE